MRTFGCVIDCYLQECVGGSSILAPTIRNAANAAAVVRPFHLRADIDSNCLLQACGVSCILASTTCKKWLWLLPRCGFSPARKHIHDRLTATCKSVGVSSILASTASTSAMAAATAQDGITTEFTQHLEEQPVHAQPATTTQFAQPIPERPVGA
eukprot:1160279-Pelagomonas_calceolata.AAC.6